MNLQKIDLFAQLGNKGIVFSHDQNRNNIFNVEHNNNLTSPSSSKNIISDKPPDYNEIQHVNSNEEVEILYNLKEYSKLRRVNNKIQVENRNVIMRTFSKDSRITAFDDIKRIMLNLNELNNRNELHKAMNGINILKSTTYKNDKLWIQKLDDFLHNTIKLNNFK